MALFSGFDAATRSYDKSTWNYEAPPAGAAGGGAGARLSSSGAQIARAAASRRKAPPAPRRSAPAGHRRRCPANVAYDVSLQHPRSVFQLLKQQYSRYTPEMVERITGIPQRPVPESRRPVHLHPHRRRHEEGRDDHLRGRVDAAHASGTQIIRTAAILQLLLGNVGRAGGGVNALRGHSNIQGATDMAGVFDILPGYLKMPAPDDVDFATYLERTTPTPSKPADWASFNYWSNTPKFAVSLLKAMYGDAATQGRTTGRFTTCRRSIASTRGWRSGTTCMRAEIKGLFAFGMNGVADRARTRERTSTR